MGVAGPSEASSGEVEVAEGVGRGLAAAGAVVVTGGGAGVMAAASRGAAEAGGTVLAILPGSQRHAANRWAQIVIPTGLGELRNGLIVRAVDALVAVGGAHGTLSEIALALKTGVPVVGVGTWKIPGLREEAETEAAVAAALRLAAGRAAAAR